MEAMCLPRWNCTMFSMTPVSPPPPSRCSVSCGSMDQITIKTPNPKCRLYWCFIEFIDLEIQSVMLVFSTPLVNQRPSYLLTGSPPLLPPSLCTGVCIYKCVTGGVGLCGEHKRELCTVYLTRFRT
jgi:hypothetical protein